MEGSTLNAREERERCSEMDVDAPGGCPQDVRDGSRPWAEPARHICMVQVEEAGRPVKTFLVTSEWRLALAATVTEVDTMEVVLEKLGMPETSRGRHEMTCPGRPGCRNTRRSLR